MEKREAKQKHRNLGLLLERNDLLNANSLLDGNGDGVLALIPGLTDLVGHLLGVGGELDVDLLLAALVHEGELTILLDVDDLPVGAGDDGDGSAVGAGDHILELLAGEDVGGDEVALGMAVLAGLGDGDGNDLAGLALDHDVSAYLRRRDMNRSVRKAEGYMYPRMMAWKMTKQNSGPE